MNLTNIQQCIKVCGTIFIIICFIGTQDVSAQEVKLEKWNFGLYYRVSSSPRPRVFVDKGPNVINPSFSFGREFGFLTEFDINSKLKLRFSFGKANTDFFYFYEHDFLIEYANAFYYPLTEEDIMSIRRRDRPLATPFHFDFLNYALSLKYQIPLKNKKYSFGVYGGFNLIQVNPINRVSYELYIEVPNGLDEEVSFPFLFEFSTNSYKVENKKFDFGLNFGIEISRRLKNYHTIGLTLGMTYIPRYITYGTYYGLSSVGEYQGSYIQSPTMLEFKVFYLLNFGGITHYSN